MRGASLPMPDGAASLLSSDGGPRGIGTGLGFLAAGVASSTSSSSSSSSSAAAAAAAQQQQQQQHERPQLLPALCGDPRNRRVAALLLAELDHAMAFVVNERRKVAGDYAKAVSLAQRYLASVRAGSSQAAAAAALPGGSGATGADSGGRTSTAAAATAVSVGGGGGPGGGGDPYLRARVKSALVALYHERARQVAFRMVTHGLVARLAECHAELLG